MGAIIRFNGKDYATLNDMPADERRRYEQVIRQIESMLPGTGTDGTPGVREIGGLSGVRTTFQTRVVVNDRTYKGPDELPPDVRQQYDEAIRPAGSGAPSSGFTLSVVSGGGRSNRDRRTADASRAGTPTAADPGAVRVELTIGRTLIAVASVIAIAAAAWFLFGPRFAGPH